MKASLQLTLLIATIFYAHLCSAQQKVANGLKYGNLLLGIEGGISAPFFSGFFNDKQYVSNGTNMTEKREWLDYNYQFTLSFSTLNRTAIGLSAGVFQYDVLPRNVYNKYYSRANVSSATDSIGIKLESASLNQYYIVPTVEFFVKDGAVPIGFFHSLGAGWGYSEIRNGSYAYSINNTPVNINDQENWTTVDYYNFKEEWKGFNHLILQYGIGLRIPLLYKHLIFSISVNSTFDFAFSPGDDILTSTSDLFSYSDIYYNARRERLFSFSIKSGIFYSL